MKTFSEFMQMMGEAGGMGTIKTKCMQCGQPQNISLFVWNSGKARCRKCGGGLDTASESPFESEEDKLVRKITELERDPDTVKGQGINDEINVLNKPEAEVYAYYKVTPEQAQQLVDKAVLLFQYKKKLRRLKPDHPLAQDDDQM